MEFTPEEREYIDRELRLADEIQKRNGNKLYPFEEVFEKILNGNYIEEEMFNYKL